MSSPASRPRFLLVVPVRYYFIDAFLERACLLTSVSTWCAARFRGKRIAGNLAGLPKKEGDVESNLAPPRRHGSSSPLLDQISALHPDTTHCTHIPRVAPRCLFLSLTSTCTLYNMAPIPRDPQQVVDDLAEQFTVDQDFLLTLTKAFLKEMHEGLSSYNHPMAMMCVPTIRWTVLLLMSVHPQTVVRNWRTQRH